MTDVSAHIRDTSAGLKNNRSDLLAAMAAEGELGRARQQAAAQEATNRQQAMIAQAAARAATIGAPEAHTADIAAMQAARNFNLDTNRAYMDAAYQRALESIGSRNDRYIEQIGEASVLQANQLDADLAAQKQLIDAQAAARAAAARRSGGGGSGNSLQDYLAALMAAQGESGPDPFAQMMDELQAASSNGAVDPAMQDEIMSRYAGQLDPTQFVQARNYWTPGDSINILQGTLDALADMPSPREGMYLDWSVDPRNPNAITPSTPRPGSSGVN